MTSLAPDLPTTESPLAADDPLALAAYQQNSETFRALNALMWQIPLIAMTLTGGLWFGVASLKDGSLSILRPVLLLLAGVGDLLLIVVLERLRHIIGEYLAWLNAAYPRGYVAAEGQYLKSKKVVKLCFQAMLAFAAGASFVLFERSMATMLEDPAGTKPRSSVAWYDAHARELADDYEGLDAAATHPQLFEMLRGVQGARILDVGAGTGRDAAALADLGHQVTAVEPSRSMLRLARRLHPGNDVQWISDMLPELKKVRGTYDVIVLSAVWMHVPPPERLAAFDRLTNLFAPKGRMYITLRLGSGDVRRGMWSVNAEEIIRLASARGLATTKLAKQPDLLGREDVGWQTLVVVRD